MCEIGYRNQLPTGILFFEVDDKILSIYTIFARSPNFYDSEA